MTGNNPDGGFNSPPLPPDLYESTRLLDEHERPTPLITTRKPGSLGPLHVVHGLSEDLVDQLVERSTDPSDTELKDQTTDRTRFRNKDEGYVAWYKKERYPFALCDPQFGTEILAGLIWYGPQDMATVAEDIPTEEVSQAREWDTIAFRTYSDYRGEGVMKAFARQVIEHWARTRGEGRGLYLEVDEKNEGAIALYTKLGFEQVGPAKERGGKMRIHMVFRGLPEENQA